MRLAHLALAAVAASLALSHAAAAADLPPRSSRAPAAFVQTAPSGFYFGSVSGVGKLADTGFGLAAGSVSVRNDYEIADYSGLRLGYAFAPLGIVTPRIEIEGGVGRASVDRHVVNGTRVASIDSFGELRAIQGYGNLYLDLNLGALPGLLGAIKPFVGGGVGAASVKLKKQGVAATGPVVDDDDLRLAYHLDAGVGIDLDKLDLFGRGTILDNTTLDLSYRFTNASDLSFTARDGTRSRTDLRSSTFLLGTRKIF